MINRLSAIVRNAGFARDVGMLSLGMLVGRGVAVLALPVVTRLYSPPDFAVLAVYVAILSIASVAACLRLEVAVPMPTSDSVAANLMVLAIAATTVIAAATAILVWLFPRELAGLLRTPDFMPFLWLVPVGIWISGAYAASQYWATRKKRFGQIAGTRLSQAGLGVGVTLGLGWVGLAPLGLLLGHMVSAGAGFVGLGLKAARSDAAAFRSVRWASLKGTFRDFRKFPLISAPEALANVAGVQVPVLIIAAIAMGPEAGFLMLAMQVMAAPMTLLGGSIGQVYLSRAPEAFRNDRLGALTASVMRSLVRVGVGPILFVGILAPVAFPLMFGDEWRRSGVIVAWMTPWIIMQFLASPVSMTLLVAGRLVDAMILQISGLVLRVGVVLLTWRLAPGWVSEAFAVTGFLFYSIYAVVVMRVAGARPAAILKNGGVTLAILASWGLAGVAVLVAAFALGL